MTSTKSPLTSIAASLIVNLQALQHSHNGDHTPRELDPVRQEVDGHPEKGTSDTGSSVEDLRKSALGLIEELKRQLQDPHEYIHEYVSSSWDHGALYAVLQADILEMLPAGGGTASIEALSSKSDIGAGKLLRILRLLACQQIVEEVNDKEFARTATSDLLVGDPDFKAWTEFQLFETRVASAYLSDSLKQSGTPSQSAFQHAWGADMYSWHAKNPDKGDRFRRAMRGVSKSLDPADRLFKDWFQSKAQRSHIQVVEMGGRYGFASIALANAFPDLRSEVRMCDPKLLAVGRASIPSQLASRIRVVPLTEQAEAQDPKGTATDISVYVIRNLLWNWTDDDAESLLRGCLSSLQNHERGTTILLCDGISPSPQAFPPHIQQAYRRRDITMMTMHNTKQRDQDEWQALFRRVSMDLEVSTTIAASDHVCKALFELRLK